MSSTAIVSKMLAERNELGTPHGRDVMGVLLFQDLAVVAFLIATPTLAEGGTDLWQALAIAGGKAAAALAVILFLGQKPMRAWFTLIARLRSPELFMLNVLLVTLGLAAMTELAGLSYALGAFLAGMLIAETEYRYQVEEDIKPFRDVLLGLFFVTVGMYLDLHVVGANIGWVLLLLIGPGAGQGCAGGRAGARCSVRRWARPCAPASISARRANSRSSCWRSPRDLSDHRRHARATGARRDGAVDARGTVRHPVLRAGRAPAHGQRLAGAGSAGDADRRAHDGAARPRHHLRLRSQRTEPRTPARGRGHFVPRARFRSRARARSRRQHERRLRRCRAPRSADRRGTEQGARGRGDIRRHADGAENPASRAAGAARSAGDRAHARRQRTRSPAEGRRRGSRSRRCSKAA